MLEKMFYTYADACKALGFDEETMRQKIARGGVSAFLHLKKEAAMLDLLSFVGGVEPDSGRNEHASWKRAKHHHPESAGSYYLLTGWFQIAPDLLQDTALFGAFNDDILVLPPKECDGLNDGDVWALMSEVVTEYDGGTHIERESSIILPTLRSLWFSKKQIADLAPEKTEVVHATTVPASGDEKPLATRERHNLLRIIVGLAKEARIDMTEGGSGAVQVEAAVAAAGFDGPKEKAIRKVLADARNVD